MTEQTPQHDAVCFEKEVASATPFWKELVVACMRNATAQYQVVHDGFVWDCVVIVVAAATLVVIAQCHVVGHSIHVCGFGARDDWHSVRRVVNTCALLALALVLGRVPFVVELVELERGEPQLELQTVLPPST